MEESQPLELASGGDDSIDKEQSSCGVDSKAGLEASVEAVADISGKTWEVSLFKQSTSDLGPEGLYVYHNKFLLLPRPVAKLGGLKTLKFFANEIEVLPPESGDLLELERLQVKVSYPGISSLPFRKFRSLKELELCRVPPKLSAFSILSDISGLKCLTKLSVCHFSIQYIPLSCLHGPISNEELSSACSFFSSLFNQETESKLSHSVFHYRYRKVDFAIKANSLKASTASDEEIREFEYKFLWEVRILLASREHNCIINIYGHHLSYKWIQETEKEQKHRILQSIIVMEHVKGGSLKNYLNRLSGNGEKHAPVDIALHVARAVACALVEVHSKKIIHRDVKG